MFVSSFPSSLKVRKNLPCPNFYLLYFLKHNFCIFILQTTSNMLKEAVFYINRELQATESAVYDVFAVLRSSRINSAEQLSDYFCLKN